jgi:uncharacterized protein YqeY
MNLADQINEDIKTAMKGGDKDKLMALRDIKSKILLEATKDGSSEVTDEKVMSILSKLNKQRMESIEIFKAQGREDLVEEEQKQANVIQAYLPQPMSAEELEAAVRAVIAQVGAAGPGDMGKVMGVASKTLSGKADGKAISEMVKTCLAS